MKKNWKKILKAALIILIVALVLMVLCSLFNIDLSWKGKNKPLLNKADSTLVSTPFDSTKSGAGAIDSNKYSKEYLRGYHDGINDCGKLSAPPQKNPTPKPPKKEIKKPDVKKEDPKDAEIPKAPEKFKPQPVKGGKTSSPVSDDVTVYLPVFSGDFGTTTSILKTGPEEAYLMYYLKNTAFKKSRGNANPPLINIGRGEDPMIYDQENELWFFIDYNTPLTTEMITASPCFAFSIYLGEFKGANFSYKMYYPHELIKPILTKVRGKEDGEITKEELKAMGAYSPNIANGNFRPNGYFGYGSTPETAQTKYYGWEVCGPLNYTIKE